MFRRTRCLQVFGFILISSVGILMVACARGQNREEASRARPGGQTAAPHDAVADAQTPQPAAAANRPEQQKTAHDNDAAAFSADAAPPSSTVFKSQPDEGKIKGFDFYQRFRN